MKIKEIKSQSQRDFTAIYVCEHCGFEKESVGKRIVYAVTD